MKKALLILLLLISNLCFSQEKKDFLVGGSFDLTKTDNDGFARKAQIALEGNYFFTPKLAATGGFEIWTGDGVSIVAGVRWYPAEHFFTRIRGLAGENDLSIGAGWNKPLSEEWRFEAMGDFYAEGEFAIRAGLMYVIKK